MLLALCPGHRWRALAGRSAGAFALLLALTQAGPLTDPHLVSTVAEGDLGKPPQVPAGLHGVGWTWEAAEDLRVTGIVGGVHGPLLLLSDGLLALHGRTGEELWTHRRPLAPGTEAGVMAGGEYSYLVHRAVPDEGDTQRVTLLDTATGEVVREYGERVRPGAPVLRTPEVILQAGYGADGAGQLVAWSAGSDDELWTFTPQEEGRVCGIDSESLLDEPSYLVHGERLLLVHSCVDEEEYAQGVLGGTPAGGLHHFGGQLESLVAVVSARDLATGGELWRREWPVLESAAGLGLARFGTGAPDEDEDFTLLLEGLSDEPLVLFDHAQGRSVGVLPGELVPYEAILHADTERTLVVVRAGGDSEGRPGTRTTALELHTLDPSGGITDTVTVDDPAVRPGAFARAVPLSETLLLPYLDEATGEPGVFTVPLSGGRGAGTWLEGVRVSPQASGDRRHELLPVPGAVVSYTDGARIRQVRGLVP